MTITVTVAELREYEKACGQWALARVNYAFQTVRVLDDRSNPFGSVAVKRGDQIEMMAKWDAENPFPKLLPPV